MTIAIAKSLPVWLGQPPPYLVTRWSELVVTEVLSVRLSSRTPYQRLQFVKTKVTLLLEIRYLNRSLKVVAVVAAQTATKNNTFLVIQGSTVKYINAKNNL